MIQAFFVPLFKHFGDIFSRELFIVHMEENVRSEQKVQTLMRKCLWEGDIKIFSFLIIWSFVNNPRKEVFVCNAAPKLVIST